MLGVRSHKGRRALFHHIAEPALSVSEPVPAMPQ